MPSFAYAIIAGVVLFMMFMVVRGAKKSFARARSANANLFQVLERLGLRVVSQDQTRVRLQGQYGGWPLSMETDGSAITSAGRWSMLEGSLAATGLGWYDDEWTQNWAEFQAKQRMQSAQMKYRWSVALPGPTPMRLFISKSGGDGMTQIANGVFARADAGAQGALSNPQLGTALAAAPFDAIRINGAAVEVLWMPEMREYQKHAISPQAFEQTNTAVLNAVTGLCNALFGGPPPAGMMPQPQRELPATVRTPVLQGPHGGAPPQQPPPRM